ncbi:hypothetical protein K492DRAFT_195954 [Lichtheimia hyalospora FSU 10163]|nr:hypothetical protein K492DRAFT_195954 [Lichtheimia hyalospora FSU 10163]
MSSMGSTHYLQQPQQARHSVPRSPSLHSLSYFITPNNTIHDHDEKRDSNSIVHVPLNTGEEDYDPSDVPMYYVGGMSSRTLVAPPVRRASWRATTGTCNTDSKYSILSAPSKICSSSTHQYIFTPPSMISLPHTDKQSGFTPVLATTKKPSRRGVCNTMTILAVVLVVLFLFAGYPITLRIAKHLKDDDA